jgi:hypothetical protein
MLLPTFWVFLLRHNSFLADPKTNVHFLGGRALVVVKSPVPGPKNRGRTGKTG